jgi:hypothetical protein
MLGGLLIGGVELVHPLIAFGIVAHQDLDKARLEIGDMLGTAVAVSNSGPSWPLFSAGAQVICPFARVSRRIAASNCSSTRTPVASRSKPLGSPRELPARSSFASRR